jgi:hypothetical protein
MQPIAGQLQSPVWQSPSRPQVSLEAHSPGTLQTNVELGLHRPVKPSHE